MPASKWYSIRNQAEERHAEILVYSEIGESFWSESVDAKTFVRDLQGLDVDTITLRLNSPGGDVFDGVAIYNALRDHDARVTVKVDGLAASIASVIMLAGDEIIMGRGAEVMIHEPWGLQMGDAAAMRKYADLLDKIRMSIVDIYADRTGAERATIEAAMLDETWYTSEEAVAAGFAHTVAGEDERQARAAMQALPARAFSRFTHVPERVAAALRTPIAPLPDPAPAEPNPATPADSSAAVTVSSDMDSDAHNRRVRELLTAR